MKGKFAFLNPNSLIGGLIGTKRPGPTYGQNPRQPSKPSSKSPRPGTSKSGFSVVISYRQNDKREGFLDPGNHQLVINSGHALAHLNRTRQKDMELSLCQSCCIGAFGRI